MKKLKVGIIGLGVGEKHIPIFESHPACEVVALCDFSKKKLSDITVRYPNIFQSANSDEILNDTNIDVVSVASFDKYHFEQVAKSIENKKDKLKVLIGNVKTTITKNSDYLYCSV